MKSGQPTRMLQFAAIIVLTLLACPLTSLGQISVGDTIVHFVSGKKPTMNVSVRNSSAEVVYVSAFAQFLVDPGADQTKTAPADDLLVSPKKFSIPSKGERTVRLLLKKRSPEMEQVYRVTFSPQGRKFDDSDEEKQKEGGILLRIMTGMGMLVFVDPANPQSDLRWERHAGKIIFSNQGNLHVRLASGKACTAEGKDCTELMSRRVYGGHSVEIPVPDGTAVTYVLREGPEGEFQTIEIPPLATGGPVTGSLREITPKATENGKTY